MGNTDEQKDLLANDDELEKLYELYLQVQSGDRTALNKLFKAADNRQICRRDEINRKERLFNMDNVLDAELVLDEEKNRQEKEWEESVYSKVTFQFQCLNKLLYKKKRNFLSKAKNTGYENGKRIKDNGNSKFYEGKYDISDFNELMYETIIEIFSSETDENNCLTLDGKKNKEMPICDGRSLLKNISYFVSRKVNKRAKNSYLDISDIGFHTEESDKEFSFFDLYVLNKYLWSGNGTSRMTIYAEYLSWLRQYDIHKLFKSNAYDIHAIIDTIMNREDIFIKDMSGDNETGFGMRFVTQEMLQRIIKFSHNINIEQGNISKDLEIIEQRLLDHLFYSLDYRIGKAEESTGIYEKESARFLYGLDNRTYVKMFGRTSYAIYDKSIELVNDNSNANKLEKYFRMIKKYEDMIMEIVSLEKGKKKYDMVNLILENKDLVEDKTKALFDIVDTVILFYQKKEEEYRRNRLTGYHIKGFTDWKKGYWETELKDGVLDIKLWSNGNVKKPIQYNINKEKLMVYCGYMNFYFCNAENKICYCVPKDRRIISRANKNHEIFMYNVS